MRAWPRGSRPGVVAVLVVFVLALSTRVALATSYAPPVKHDVPSPNGAFVLHVDPESKVQTVVAARDPATRLWSFHHDVDFSSLLVSNDGRTVAVVGWRFVQVDDLDDPAVELWNAGGRFGAYTYRDLIARPPRIRGVGPIGSFWRQWRTDATIDDHVLVVTTTGPFVCTFELTTGELDRRVSIAHALVWLLGLVMLALAASGAIWARRAMRRSGSALERRRLLTAMLAPIGALVWLWLDLAGLPLVPAAIQDDVQLAVFVVSFVAAPVSLITAALLPRGMRGVRLALIVALVVALLAVRIGW